MVLFILTRAGWDEMADRVCEGSVVWVNHGVLTAEELASLRTAGVDLTSLSSPMDPAKAGELAETLVTIAEHHPGERLWVELPLPSIAWLTGIEAPG